MTKKPEVPSAAQDPLAQIPKKISLHSQLPIFKDVPANQKTILFISKLRQCNKLVRADDQELRKLKHLVLYQLLEYVNAQNNVFPVEAIPDFFNTVSVNIFRQAPKPQAEDDDADPEEDEALVDPNWFHLQFVYELLLRFVYSAQSQVPDYQRAVKKHIDCDFATRLMQLFGQSDPRERDYVKTVLHRIYANVMGLRAFIRNLLRSELQTFFSGAQQHSGICDILEVLGSIINGYATPLKPEHIQFLTHCLVPMHRVQYIKPILPQLSYCVSKFVEKEPALSGYILHQISTFYPRLNSHKEVSILTEIEELLELMPPDAVLNTADKLDIGFKTEHPLQVYDEVFEIVANAINSIHFQVAEKAVNLVGNQKFLVHVQNAFNKFQELHGSTPMLMENVESPDPTTAKPQQNDVYQKHNPIYTLGRALRANCAHWNSNIRFLSDQSLKQLSQISPSEISGLDSRMLRELVVKEYKSQVRQAVFDQLAKQALSNISKFGTYFQDRPAYDTNEHVPGYEQEVISLTVVQEAQVPEDPLFCRHIEMSLKHLEAVPENVIGALDGAVMDEYKIAQPTDQTTVFDAAIKRAKLYSKQVEDKIVDEAVTRIQQAGQARVQESDMGGQKLFSVNVKMPAKRLANRRASAGISVNTGVRRKSVVPLTQQQLENKQELQKFEKHSIAQDKEETKE